MTTARRTALKTLALGLAAAATVLLVLAGLRVRQDAQQARQFRVLRGHVSCASALVFSPDGKRLYTADWSGTVRIWQMPQGKLLRIFAFTGIPINTLALTPDGTQLVAGNDRGQVLRWEVGSERSLPPLTVGPPVRRVAFSPEGREMAVVAHETPAVLRFEAQTGLPQGRIPTQHPVTTIGYSPDGKTLAVADTNSVAFWDRTAQQFRRTLRQTEVASVTFSPDSKTFVASGTYRDANLYRVSDASLIQHLRVDQTGNAAFLPDGKHFLLGHGADLTPYDVQGKSSPSLVPTALLASTPQFLMRMFPLLREFQRLRVETVVISPDGKLVAFSVQEDVTLMPLPTR